MQDNKQAKLKLKLAFSPRLKLVSIGVLNKITHRIILIICSKNSVKLIAKKCLFPQSALLKMQYIAEKTKEGSANKTIEVDIFCGLIIPNNSGNKNNKTLINKLSKTVITSPALTTAYEELLFCL